ncbi:MAG: CRP-like cAMP-binding protein [Flavobacteriaceae bacterium]
MNKIKTTENIFTHFEKFIKLSENLKLELSKRIKPIVFQKGELVLDANNISKKSYFINKGILRTYFIKDGKEISEYFSGIDEWGKLTEKLYAKRKRHLLH